MKMATRESVENELACVEAFLVFWSLKRVLGFALPFVCLWAGYSCIETLWYEDNLPPALRTTGLATTGSDLHLFDLMTPVRSKVCGAATFTLTGPTVGAIKAQGLAFFEHARKPRGDPRDRPRLAYEYTAWRETPVPPAWTSDGMWAGLSCMGWTWSQLDIYEAARAPGSYYTERPGAQLLVVPRLGLAAFTYRD
jgi:hypothetical protein